MGIERDLRIAVVDDDDEVRHSAQQMLAEFGCAHHCRTKNALFRTGEEFIASGPAHQYDIVLMDIFMRGMDGTECARRLRADDAACLLIFLTTSTEHMPDAFSCHAFDYLHKPFRPDRLADVLCDALRVLPINRPTVEFVSSRQNVQLCLEDICSVISDAHYVRIKSADGSETRVRMKLDGFFDAVDCDPRFLRINRGIAVNVDHITGIGKGCCMLSDGSCLPLRARDGRSLERAIRQYHFDAIRSRQRQP